MNKYKLRMRTPTGLGNEYVYVYATDNFERYLNKHNLKYARDITKDYQLTDRFEMMQQERDKYKSIVEELKEIYSNTIKHLRKIGNDELAEYMEAQISNNNVFVVNDM